MNAKYLKKLEYNEIIKKLSNYCETYIGKEIANVLLPSNNKEEVRKLLRETEEAVNLIYRNSTPIFEQIEDVTFEIKKLESNSALSAKSLLNISKIFRLAQNLKDYYNKDFLDIAEFPSLTNLFNNLYSNKGITEKIFSSIIDENTIDDKASKNLKSIRSKKRKIEQDIKSKLNDLIHSSANSKYIQENVITIRNERYVIPVKEEYRTQIRGFIHDISNGGSTVFIEPISVFEMNNELNKLNIDETQEIEKILFELTKIFFPYVNEITEDIKIIGKLDFIFAKAKFSKALNAVTPIINEKKEICLKNARHPLIESKKVVPITLELGNEFSVLVITGPNTGGKTVTLKTVGLLICMACSGLNIPCDQNSSIYVFDNIFADIGDDQSISESLSTFSAHMKNIVEITNNATENSLILVDELGSGTDPLEGANLAISILDYFKSISSLTIATTHYQELKQYALVTKEFENASVEFDVQTLSPTYRLLVGIPGKSNAFEISKKLGLSENIIKKAKSQMSSSQIDIENLLKNIYDNKSLIEKEKKQIEEKLSNISNLEELLKRDNTKLKVEEKDIINNAKVQARNILLEAKEEASLIIKQMNSKGSSKELNNLRNDLNNKIKNIKLEEEISENKEKVKPEEIKKDMEVYIKNLYTIGTIISTHVSKSNEIQVQIGSIKTNVNINNLAKIKNKSKKQENKSTSHINISKTKNAKTEINVIGLNVSEAIFVVDKFLDDCSLAKLQTVRIVHGKGTGKLREGIHKFLKTNSHVESFRIGTFGEGEMGVTVVKMKK